MYDYDEEVDEDLMCQICLQPFVNPTDTPCSHTFCQACLTAYLRVNSTCPICRKPLNQLTCTPSNLVLKRLLDKLPVVCPHNDSCTEKTPRGNLEDHLKYRCEGTLVACQFAGAGCEHRGPAKRMKDHQTECTFKKEGITRLPILEGEVSHVEIPRTSPALGITIVGGSDTPLRCVVVQEVFPDGLVAGDGRLQPGDQLIEINGVDMTCATHAQVCAALRKMSSVLRLGVYRERIEKYGVRRRNNQSQAGAVIGQSNGEAGGSTARADEEVITVTLERQPGRHLGIRISGSCPQPGIFIVDILEDSITALDGRIRSYDRLLYVNGADVSNFKIKQASDLIKNNEKVVLVVARKIQDQVGVNGCSNGDEVDGNHQRRANGQHNGSSHQNGHHAVGGGEASPGPQSHPGIRLSHTRSKSAPVPYTKGDSDTDTASEIIHQDDLNSPSGRDEVDHPGAGVRACSDDMLAEHYYDIPEGEDYLAIYETIDRKRQDAKEFKNKSASMEELETPTPSLKSFNFNINSNNIATSGATAEPQVREKKRHRSKSGSKSEHRRSVHGGPTIQPPPTTSNTEEADDLNLALPPPEQPPFPCRDVTTPRDPAPVPRDSAASTPREPMPLPREAKCMSPPPLEGGGGRGHGEIEGMAQFLRKALRIEGPQLNPKTVTIRKNVRESLGMRIGGGIGSNEGDTPIYIANIHPHGCIGKSKQLKKGDLLLRVNEASLDGLTHAQAVATLKATINVSSVVLVAMDGPETSYGASNFIPSWMYWQKLPRTLQYPKTVILHRRDGTSWGFSIVGGADPSTDRTEPVHVLFVVPESPAAKDGKLKCGDRLLAVDGQSLETVAHSTAVSMLKRTSTRVVMEVVSWLGTEI